MRNRHRYGNLLGYVDISMNLLMCFIVLFAFAFMLMRLEQTVTDNKAKLSTTSRLVIHLSWPEKSEDDIDVWARSTNPEGMVGFKNKDAPNMFLDNDNLGMNSHKVAKSDGTMTTSFGNNEHIQIKNCSNTHITVNLHYYKSSTNQPVEAVVELISMEPFFVIRLASIKLDKPGQERTVFQFDLDENCAVKNITDEQSLFVISNLPTPGSSIQMAPLPKAPGGP